MAQDEHPIGQQQQIQAQLTEDQLKNATTAKEVIDSIDITIVNYLDLMYDSIDRQTVIYPIYKTMINHVANKLKIANAPYRVVAKVASQLSIDLLADLAEKETIFVEEEMNDL
jgi:hypothetical protein